MSDRMQKEAMDKFITNIKNMNSSARHYTPPPYSYYPHSPFMLPNMQAMKEKDHDKKMPLISDHQQYPPSSLYNYPSYPPYGMNYPGAPFSMEAQQPHQHKNTQQDKMRAEQAGHIKNGYGSYYHPLMHPSQPYSPYSYYSYNSLYPHYGYPRGEGLFSSQRIVNNPVSQPQSPHINHKEKQKKNLKNEIIILSDSEEQNIKKKKEKFENVIDVQKNDNQEIKKQIPNKQGKKIVEQPKQQSQISNDPFYIKKKHKITKTTEKSKNISPSVPQKNKDEPPKDKPSRYNIMPAEIYQQMVKKQSQIGLQMFLQRQREKFREREKEKDRYSEKNKTSRNRQQNYMELPIRQKNKKPSWENQINFANQEYEQQIKRFSQKIAGIKDQKEIFKIEEKPAHKKQEKAKQPLKKEENQQLKKKTITQPTTSLMSDDKDAKKERIRDDHPLKQLRYSESHGRIRLGPYFQSNIPNLVTVQQSKLIKMRLQKKLRQRQISAITF